MTFRPLKRGSFQPVRSIYTASVIATLAMVATVAMPESSAEAATPTHPVTMTAAVGYAGYFNENHWIPVNISIDNVGKPVSARLVLSVNGFTPSGPSQNGRVEWPLHIPTGWSKKFIAVPGNILSKLTSPEVDCVSNGRIIATTYLNATRIDNNDLVAVLSTQAISAQFLTGTTGPSPANNPVLPFALYPADFPDKPNLLDTLTAVVTTPTTLFGLKKDQQEALWTWVRMGGMLFVTGVKWGGTTPALPIVAGPDHWVSGSLFANLVPKTPLHRTLLMEGEGIRQGARIIAGSKTLPLIASMTVGRGAVVQTSFFPTQSVLLQWPGDVSLWSTLLKQMDNTSLNAVQNLLDPNGILTLSRASDSLSPLRVPSLRYWGMIFSAYIFLVGPLAFFVLKRLRKQSLAWGVLPLLSVVTTVSIYSFGETKRPEGMLTEGVAVVDLVGNSQAESYGISAFMSPHTVDVTAHTSQPTLLLPLAQEGIRRIGTATITQTHKSSFASFDAVGRWGMRYLYSAGSITGQGEFNTTLDSTYYFTGTIQNQTPYTLHDVAVFWNDKMFPIGDMAPGRRVMLKEPESAPFVSTPSWLLAYSAYNHDILHGVGRRLGEYSAPLINLTLNQNQALIVATTTERPPTLPRLTAHNGKTASSTTLTLVRQIVNVADYPLG